jgi:hypothetical protein
MLTPMVFASDLGRMRSFYAEGFGLVEDSDASTDGFVVLTGPGTRLALHGLPDNVAARITIDDPPVVRSDTALKLLFATPDVAAARALLTGLGAQMFEPGGDGSVDGADPEGNVFRIYQA